MRIHKKESETGTKGDTLENKLKIKVVTITDDGNNLQNSTKSIEILTLDLSVESSLKKDMDWVKSNPEDVTENV